MSKYSVEKIGMGSVKVWSIFRGFCKDSSLRVQWTPGVWTKERPASSSLIGFWGFIPEGKGRTWLASNTTTQGTVLSLEVVGQQQSLCWVLGSRARLQGIRPGLVVCAENSSLRAMGALEGTAGERCNPFSSGGSRDRLNQKVTECISATYGLSQGPRLVGTFSAHHTWISDLWARPPAVRARASPSLLILADALVCQPRLLSQSLLFEWVNIARSQNSIHVNTSPLPT